MHRIDSPTAHVGKFGPGRNGYTEGDPLHGVPATKTTAPAFDALQEEPARVIEHVGHPLNKADHSQLLQSILGLVQLPSALRWTAHPAGPISAVSAGCQWMGSTCLVGEDGGVFRVDSLSIETITPPTASHLLGVGAHGGTIIAVGAGGTIVRSTSETWPVFTGPSSGVSSDLRGSAVGNTPAGTRWVVVGAGGTILRSTNDGVTWTPVTSGVSTDLNAVIYLADPASANEWGSRISGIWVAVGAAGVILTSTDGVEWSAASPPLMGWDELHHVAGSWNGLRQHPIVMATGTQRVWSYDLTQWSAKPSTSYGGVACSIDGTIWVEGELNGVVLATPAPGRDMISVETGMGSIPTGIVYWNMGQHQGRFIAGTDAGEVYLSDLIVR